MGQEASVPINNNDGLMGHDHVHHTTLDESFEEQARAPPSTGQQPIITTTPSVLQQQYPVSPKSTTKRSKMHLVVPNMLFHRSSTNQKEQHPPPPPSIIQNNTNYSDNMDVPGIDSYERSGIMMNDDHVTTTTTTNNNNNNNQQHIISSSLQKIPSNVDHNITTTGMEQQQQHIKHGPSNSSNNGWLQSMSPSKLLDTVTISSSSSSIGSSTTNNNTTTPVMNHPQHHSSSMSMMNQPNGSLSSDGSSTFATTTTTATNTSTTTTNNTVTPTKKLFGSSGRSVNISARNMINSMRNLSIGGSSNSNSRNQQQQTNTITLSSKPIKEVQEWEKQWDADDDDDDDDDDDNNDSDHDDTTTNNNQLPNHLPQQLSSTIVSPSPLTINDQQQQHPSITTTPMDLLSSPNGISDQQVQQHQSYTTTTTTNQLNNLSTSISLDDFDIVPSSSPMLIPDDDTTTILNKPNVQMFLPVLRVLGKGSFGKVVLVQKREGKERGQLFAMKILKKTHLVKRRQIERTMTERKVLSAVNHPFIMKLHYAFQTPDKLYLVLDYCPGGELFFHLSRFRRFPERVARFYAAELLLAIGHLHKRGIIYRDLKPENVLLDADGHVKLGDFGLAKAGIQHPYEGATSMCGTPEYMAPEVLGQLGHGFCVDYWGLGMIVYEMMTGLPPWYTTDRSQLFRRLKSAPLDIPSYFSESSADCVSALLERNPRRRLGVTGIRTAMEHPFFRNLSWRALYSRRVEAPVQPCEGWKPPDGSYDPTSGIASSSQFHSTDGMIKLDANMLDSATQNFDAQFTRMAVESEDHHMQSNGMSGNPIDDELLDELNEETFLGFSFDIIKERDIAALLDMAGATSSTVLSEQQPSVTTRHRTIHYHNPIDGKDQS